jgi:hypothetical protein
MKSRRRDKMFYKIFTFILMIQLLGVLKTSAQNWECEECPPRSIGLFDCEVQVPQPSWGQSLTLGDWLEFSFVGHGISEELFLNDPSKSCLSFYDGQFVLAADSLPDFDSVSYQVSYNWQNLPGSGSLSYADYIVYSKLYQSGSGYEIIVYLETGKTREIVAQNTIQYNPAIAGVNNGKNAAQFLKPLLGKIRDFEKQKRNQLSDVAIEAKLEVKPQKFYLNTNESTQIILRLKDCDDFKLPNRELNLTASSGALSSNSVITNNEGEAEVTYTAGSSPAWVEIYGEHVYYYPHGAGEIGAVDAKFISVNKSSADVWDFTATVNVSLTSFADTSWAIIIPNVPTITDYRSFYKRYSGTVTVSGLIQNECGVYGNDFCYTENEPPVLWFFYGNISEFSKNKETEYLNGVLEIWGETVTFCNELAVGSEIRTDNYRINADDASVNLEYSSIIKYFSVGGYGNGEENYHNKRWESGGFWQIFQGNYSRSADVDVSWTEPEPHGSFTYQDSVYSFNYNGTETLYTHNFEYGTIQTTITKNLNGKLKPFYRTITSVDENYFNFSAVPDDYGIINYPNPFNPSTVISYRLPVRSIITLKVYDILGNEVATLVNEEKPAGRYEVEFNSHSGLPSGEVRNLVSGVYFCRLSVVPKAQRDLVLKDGQTENYSKTIKMLYLK